MKKLFLVLVFHIYLKFRYKDYIIQIQKTKSNDFNITISKITKQKSGGLFTCGKTNNNNVKNISSFTLNNDGLNVINDEALKSDPKPYTIPDFMILGAREFVKILKSMSAGSN